MCDIMNFENVRIAESVLAMEKAIAESTEDGVVYQNGYMIVERKGGKIFMRGTPIRVPMRITSSGAPRVGD